MIKSVRECEHEVDWEGVIEPCDYDDIAKYKSACIKVRCRKCGCRGISVDDGDDFWEGQDF